VISTRKVALSQVTKGYDFKQMNMEHHHIHLFSFLRIVLALTLTSPHYICFPVNPLKHSAYTEHINKWHFGKHCCKLKLRNHCSLEWRGHIVGPPCATCLLESAVERHLFFPLVSHPVHFIQKHIWCMMGSTQSFVQWAPVSFLKGEMARARNTAPPPPPYTWWCGTGSWWSLSA
jgi:hypothetical protein